MIYTVSKKTILILFLVMILFLFWCTIKNSRWYKPTTGAAIDPKLICEIDNDCTYQETACHNCWCDTAVNKNYKVDIQCPKPTDINQCNLACPITQVKCIKNICTNDNL